MSEPTLFPFMFCAVLLTGCAGVSTSISSVPSLSETPDFNTSKIYSYSDKDVSSEVNLGDIDLHFGPYNSARTSNYQELFFIPVDKKKEYISDAGETPFKVEVWVKGEKGLYLFEPFLSRYNGKQHVSSVMYREGDPNINCRNHYHYYEWKQLKNITSPPVADRTRNFGKPCYYQGWIEYLIEFDDITPRPENTFNIELYFTNTKSNQTFSQKVYFHGARFKTITTN